MALAISNTLNPCACSSCTRAGTARRSRPGHPRYVTSRDPEAQRAAHIEFARGAVRRHLRQSAASLSAAGGVEEPYELRRRPRGLAYHAAGHFLSSAHGNARRYIGELLLNLPTHRRQRLSDCLNLLPLPLWFEHSAEVINLTKQPHPVQHHRLLNLAALCRSIINSPFGRCSNRLPRTHV